MTKRRLKLVFQINLVLFLLLIPAFQRVNAQWPPFSFALTPRFENDRITYSMRFASKVDWAMRNVVFRISVPEGTRFLEASALPTTRVDFDGEEVTFFTSDFQHPIRDAFFVVEVIDPTKTVFTTQAWIAWEGDQPGDYLAEEVAIDITRQPLNWSRPLPSDLHLEVKAIAADDIITYEICPKNVTRRRIWDSKINVPIPEGTDLLQVEAPPAFVTDFDGKEVTFSIVELERETEYPLSFQISTDGITSPFVATRAWAVWKNVGRNVGQSIPLEDQTVTGDIIVQPHVTEQVVPDAIGDVPFSNYDLTSISLQEDGPDLRINFYTAGEIGSTDEPLIFHLFIDADCNADNGDTHIRGMGAEYLVQYMHSKRMADLKSWDPDSESWRGSVALDSLASGRMVVVWVPSNLLDSDQQFCWEARARNNIKGFDPNPPADWVPSRERQWQTQYESIGFVAQSITSQEATYEEPLAPSISAEPEVEEAYLIHFGETWRYLKGYGEASYPIMAWQQVGYDDTDWQAGPTGFGYSDGDDATVLDDMQSNYLSVFIRRSFDVSDPNEAKSLTLEIDYDDGFVAYLNGTEVVRRNMDSTDDAVLFNTQAASGHEAGQVEVIDLSSFINLLAPGENVLAIQGHNDRKDGADFSIIPALRWEYTVQPPADAEVSAVELSVTTSFINATDRVIPPIYYGNDGSTAISPVVYTDTTTISGKLAVPINSDQDHYDLYVFSLPDGRETVKITNARQPNIRFDGQRMLINREGGGVENIFEYDFTDGTENQVSDAPRDSLPFYDSWGNRVAYGNSELTVGADGLRHPYIFVQCGLLPPHQEQEQRCRDIPQFGILVPAGQMGEIQGDHPVWLANDMIAYRGCNSWAGYAACGIYVVPSTSTKGFSNGFIPRQLTTDTNDIPSDAKGDLIAFTSERDGNWEAYVMNLNGDWTRNVSNSSDSNDGLPTISPDGNWVAFASDRDGQWAIWVVPVGGGSAQKLFDLPADNPWGVGDRTWTNERISWGP